MPPWVEASTRWVEVVAVGEEAETWMVAGVAVGAAAVKVASCHARSACLAAPSQETSGGPAWPARAAAAPPPTPATGSLVTCSPWPSAPSANTSYMPPRWCNLSCDAPAEKSGNKAPPSPATKHPSLQLPPRFEPRYGATTASPSTAWAAPKPGDPALLPACPAGMSSLAPGKVQRFLPTTRRRGQAPRRARCAEAMPTRPMRSPPVPGGVRCPVGGRRWSPWW
jgi:hypothetical protein